MKLKSVTIQNFRCFKESKTVEFDNLTTLIGKNDIGKSTILEALEIFFNNDIVKISADDLNNHAEDSKVSITCEFSSLPEKLILDSGAETNLEEEFLTCCNDVLRIRKEYDCSKAKPSEEIFIVANHPTAEGMNNLLGLKEKELQKLVKDLGLEVSLKGNPEMRKAIWNSCDDLRCQTVSISVTKDKGDAARIWNSLEQYLPIYALFQSDRSSKDSDDEVQNPMKVAIQTALKEAEDEIQAIKEKVRARAMDIARGTYEVMKSLDANLASSLTPTFTDAAMSKWGGLFSVSMNTNDNIPLNKRGSGIRRLVLVSFFKAQADKRAIETANNDIIYAIEEPETSLHPNYQRLIIQSFYDLAQDVHCQVILTTHSPNLAQELPVKSIRFITRDEYNFPAIKSDDTILSEVVHTLGVLPNPAPNVKVLICVEGPTDVNAIRCFSRCLHDKYPEIINVENDFRVVIVPLGGSTLKHWVQERYLKALGCPEVHIYDNDVKTYQESIDEVNSRGDGSWGTLTFKYEIENYLHPKAIQEAYGFEIDTTKQNVPALFGEKYAQERGWPKCKDNTSKYYLSIVFDQKMTIDYLEEIDTKGEIKGWFEKITEMVK